MFSCSVNLSFQVLPPSFEYIAEMRALPQSLPSDV